MRLFVRWLAIVALLLVPAAAQGQELLERSPNLSGGWVGLPWFLHSGLPHRFIDIDPNEHDLRSSPTFLLALGLPHRTLVGAQFAPESNVGGLGAEEWFVFARWAPLSQARGAPLSLGVDVGYNTASESVDAALSLARWFGPVRLLGEARAFSSPYDFIGDDRAVAVAGGIVVHPFPGRVPIALAGDVSRLLSELNGDVETAWSAGVQVGISFTPLTFSLFATNTRTATFEGISLGGDDVHLGFALEYAIPVGRFVGGFASRESAGKAVVTDAAAGSGRVARAPIRRYAFLPKRLVIEAGTTVEWTNYDDVVHTVTANQGAWGSAAIRPGETWSATFTEPGRYPYHCAPHPFMKAIVIVR